MIGDRDSVRELRGDSHRLIQEWVSDQLDGGGAHGQGGAALAGGAGGDTAVITSLNKAADLRTVLVLALRLTRAALAHGDGGELPGVTEHRGAGHVVTAAIPGADVGVRAARAGAGGGEVTIGAEAGLTLSVQTRGLQIVKTEERVWAALTRGHGGHRPVLTSLIAASDSVTVVPGAEQGAGAAPALGCGGNVTPGAELGQAADGGAVPGNPGAIAQERGQHLGTLAGVRTAALGVGRGWLTIRAENIGANNVLTKLTP